MVTWTTYGTWLPGDKRGYVEDGIIFADDPEFFERNKQGQKSPSVKLSSREKEIVKQTILEQAHRIGHKIEALAVCTNHVHLVARPYLQPIENIVGRYKSLTTRTLWQYNRKGRIWTKGHDKRFCFSEKELEQRIRYVNNHND